MASFLKTPVAPAHEPSLAQEFCSATRLTAALPKHLISDAQGRPFEPVRLAFTDDLRSIPEQWSLLLRRERVGGAEPLLRTNSERIKEEAFHRLHQHLASDAQAGPTQTLLLEVRREVQVLKERLATRAGEIEQAYSDTQQTLADWQEATTQQPGLIQNVVGWMLGGAGQISLLQAVTLWNERERLGLQTMCYTAALNILTQVLDAVTQLRDRLEVAREHVHHAALQAQQQIVTLERPTDGYAPWTWQGDVPTIAAQLARQANTTDLAVALFSRVGTDGGVDRLAEHAQELAAEEATRRLTALTLTDLIACEAAALPVEGVDPVVVIGQWLCETLLQQPTWRLARTAHPRLEMVQITPDGAPLYRMDGLSTAAYGTPVDRIGFVYVELHVAVDDLRLMHEGDEAFHQALSLRNFYVLDALAEEWETQASISTPAVQPSSNGVLLVEQVPTLMPTGAAP